MQIAISRERPDSTDAARLIEELDGALNEAYAQESRHGYSIQKLIDQEVHFFVARTDGDLAGCGGIQFFGGEYGELKRMFVRPAWRGHGIGKAILVHLAEHAAKQGVSLLRLETGIHQIEAIGLYEKFGFYRIPPFGPYRDDPVSLCYEMRLP